MKTVFVLFCPLGSKICAHCLAKWFHPKILRDTKEWHLDITVGVFMYKMPTTKVSCSGFFIDYTNVLSWKVILMVRNISIKHTNDLSVHEWSKIYNLCQHSQRSFHLKDHLNVQYNYGQYFLFSSRKKLLRNLTLYECVVFVFR